MAEGGQEDDQNNPFSFKNFVTKKDKVVPETKSPQNEDDLDIFSMPDAGSRRKKEKSKQILVVDEEEPKQQKKKEKKGRKENPFSFKKFLSGPSEGTRPRTQETTRGPDVISGDLPGFVQDHYSDSSVQSSPKLFDLPDFTQTSATVPDIGLFNNVQYSSNTLPDDNTGAVRTSRNVNAQHNDRASVSLVTNSHDATDSVLDSDNETEDFDNLSDHEHHHAVSIGHSLPDFLSDTGLRGSVSPVDTNLSEHHPSVIASAAEKAQIQQLNESNIQLRKQLEDLKKQKTRDSECIAGLRRELAEQKQKEVEETATMERAMEQVEENLSTTTKRAVQAEASVAKLKQDVKNLQAEVLTLRGGNGVAGDQFHTELKERTRYVAEQLTTATKTAETSLKQLLSGVDSLNMLSKVLISIDKISEQKPSPEENKQFDTT